MTDKTLVCRDCGEEFVFTVENKNSTKKKDLLMNLQDVYLAEELKRNKIIEDNIILLRVVRFSYNSF